MEKRLACLIPFGFNYEALQVEHDAVGQKTISIVLTPFEIKVMMTGAGTCSIALAIVSSQ